MTSHKAGGTVRPTDSGSPELVEAVAAAVLAVPGVSDLHGGTFGEVATYLPGRRVKGVRQLGETTEVHVVLLWGAPVVATADAVRQSVHTLVRGPVDVYVEDVVDPDPVHADGPPR